MNSRARRTQLFCAVQRERWPGFAGGESNFSVILIAAIIAGELLLANFANLSPSAVIEPHKFDVQVLPIHFERNDFADDFHYK
jgi:hypothetical protein